jgi:hypothetical protein
MNYQMAKKPFKECIGDGTYANYDGYSIILTTENGITTQNTIYLEPEAIASLQKYLTNLPEKIKQYKNEN